VCSSDLDAMFAPLENPTATTRDASKPRRFDASPTKSASSLADFVGDASKRLGFAASRVVAVGFSNGANIASSVLLLRPGVLAGAVIFRGQVPIVPEPMPAPTASRVLISNGRIDPLVNPAETERLVALLRSAGAEVTLAWQPGGHNLTLDDIVRARTWMQENFTSA